MGLVQMRFAVLAVLAAVLVGCGGDDADAPATTGPTSAGEPLARSGPVPAGWKVTATRFFTYAHPADWTVNVRPSKSGSPGEVVAEARGPESTPGLPPDVAVAATPDYKSSLGALLALNATDAKLRYRDRKVLKASVPTVPGSTGGRLIEGQVQNKGPDGKVTPVRQFDLVVLSKEKTAVSLFVQVPDSEAESSRVREVVASLEVR